MPSVLKNEISLSEFEVDVYDLKLQTKLRLIGIVHGLRVGLTVLALAAGIAILGLAADALAIYRQTHLPADFFLPLWPEDLDLRPAVALVAGGVVVAVANVVSLVFSKAQALRRRAGLHAGISLAAPAAGVVAAVVAMTLFYAVNSSATVDTLQSWACRWTAVPMTMQPRFGTFCAQSRAGVALSVLLVPLETLVLGMAGYQAILERQTKSIRRIGA